MSDQAKIEATVMSDQFQEQIQVRVNRINQLQELAKEGKATPEDQQELQVQMVELQALIEKRDEALEAVTNFQAKSDGTRRAIIENIK